MTEMYVARGEKLKEYVNEVLDNENITRERFLLKDLHSYVSSEKNRDVLCLYGLRRTGKTIMMMQEIQNLDDYDNILFMRCNENVTLAQIRMIIDTTLTANPKCRKIFIDEVTKAKWFINYSSFLADDYSARGIRIVLTGTDSLSFMIASNSELYDRATFLHTTYISFKEYNYLLGKSLDDYIKYGGTLTEDGVKNAFYDPESTDKYTNSAIVENILHTLKRWNDGDNVGYDVLSDFIDNDILALAINKVLEYHNHDIECKYINKSFKSRECGSVMQLMGDRSSVTEDIRQLIKNSLEKDHRSIRKDDKSIEFLVKYLKELDVLYTIPKVKNLDCENNRKYLFTQVGMRYSQVTQQIKALSDVDGVDDTYLEKLKSDVSDQILEDVILGQLLRENSNSDELAFNREISRYRSEEFQGAEINIVISDKKAKSVLLIEVKHSNQKVEEQHQQLNRTDVCSDIEHKTGNKIVNKVIVYRGENCETEDGVLYLNANDFLIHSQEMVQVLLNTPQIKTFSQLESLVKKQC